jgi:hypothetical protein
MEADAPEALRLSIRAAPMLTKLFPKVIIASLLQPKVQHPWQSHLTAPHG